jgi:hypothetical protein
VVNSLDRNCTHVTVLPAKESKMSRTQTHVLSRNVKLSFSADDAISNPVYINLKKDAMKNIIF